MLDEYGIGIGTAAGLAVLPDDAPATFSNDDIDALVDSVAAQHPPTASTIYSILMPLHTTLIEGGGATDSFCDYGAGYHQNTKSGLIYAVTAHCSDDPSEPTWTLSHELVEASTDPYPFTEPAYEGVHPPAELADLCLDPTQITLDSEAVDGGVPDGGNASFGVTRVYSNARAAAGNQDPCVPAPMTPYFGAAVDPGHLTVALDGEGDGTTSFSLELFSFGSDAPIPWRFYGAPGMKLTPASGSNRPGEVVSIQMQVTGAQQSQYDSFIYAIAGPVDGVTQYWTASVTYE